MARYNPSAHLILDEIGHHCPIYELTMQTAPAMMPNDRDVVEPLYIGNHTAYGRRYIIIKPLPESP